MSDGPDQERANILDFVRAGKMMPAQAELWARATGREPFEKRPDVSALDPMKEELWTLPMAAAWFIWHSPHAVRDQWNLARKSWTKWIPLTDRLHKVPPRPNRRRWDLKLFRRANLDDVFAQTGFHPIDFGRRSVGRRLFKGSADGGSNRQADNPYHRFKVALQTGKLIATYMRPGEQAQIPAEYWIAEFEEFEDPLGFDLPGSPSAHDRRATPSEKPFESAFAVDLSDMLDEKSNDWEIPNPRRKATYTFFASTPSRLKKKSHKESSDDPTGTRTSLGVAGLSKCQRLSFIRPGGVEPADILRRELPAGFPEPAARGGAERGAHQRRPEGLRRPGERGGAGQMVAYGGLGCSWRQIPTRRRASDRN